MIKTKHDFMRRYDPAWEAFVLRAFTIESADTNISDTITATVERLVLNGVLKNNDPLPSTDRLAKHLGVAKFAVQHAYTKLGADGTIKTATRAGTWAVSARAPFRASIGSALSAGRRVGLTYEEMEKDVISELKRLKSTLHKRRQLK